MREAAQKFVGEHDFRNFCRVSMCVSDCVCIVCVYHSLRVAWPF